MRRLDLDYQRSSSRVSWAAWALLAAGLLLCGEMALSYAKVYRELGGLEDSMRAGTMRREASRGAHRNYSPDELDKAQETIEKIAVPWNGLFKALASAETDQVALLALEPDPRGGTLSLYGEAHDFPSLLTYISKLGRVGIFHDVYLQHHEIRQDDPNRSVTFLITAHWEKS